MTGQHSPVSVFAEFLIKHGVEDEWYTAKEISEISGFGIKGINNFMDDLQDSDCVMTRKRETDIQGPNPTEYKFPL